MMHFAALGRLLNCTLTHLSTHIYLLGTCYAGAISATCAATLELAASRRIQEDGHHNTAQWWLRVEKFKFVKTHSDDLKPSGKVPGGCDCKRKYSHWDIPYRHWDWGRNYRQRRRSWGRRSRGHWGNVSLAKGIPCAREMTQGSADLANWDWW